MAAEVATATIYAEFAAREARGVSDAYERLSLDGRPLAWTRSHGQELVWFA